MPTTLTPTSQPPSRMTTLTLKKAVLPQEQDLVLRVLRKAVSWEAAASTPLHSILCIMPKLKMAS